MGSVVASLTASAEPFNQLAGGVESIATVIALIFGGLWTYRLFVKNRLDKPCANLAHAVGVRDLGSEGSLIHVTVQVKNESAVMMRLISGEVRISPVLPLLPDVVPQLDAFRRSDEPRGQEIDWPGRLAYEFDWSDKPREIEPHESDSYDFDFVIERSTVTFEVYSYFSNPTKKRQDIGWGLTTLHDVGGENESAGPSRVEAGS